MKEIWLAPPKNNFHKLVFNTPIQYPLCQNRESALYYLKMITNKDFFYTSFSNYNLIDANKIIYIEEEFKDDEEIIELIAQIKQIIKTGYQYKHQYKARISDFISKDRFDTEFDDFMVSIFNFPKPLNEKEER